MKPKTSVEAAGDARREAIPIGALESSALIAHIQTAAENQKALLARELHDELGGLLVGAVMDLAWAEHHLSSPATEVRQKLSRARHTLSAAIDLKRKLIEDLRPTLLDNVGLFAALRWHVQATCKLAAMTCEITLPLEEKPFVPHVPIALFRIVQEALAVIIAEGRPTATEFSVCATQDSLVIRFSSHRGPDESRAALLEPHSLAAVRYRTNALGGIFSYEGNATRGSNITATLPLGNMIAAD